MNKIQYVLKNELTDEQKRLISFASDKIDEYVIRDGKIELTVKEECEEEVFEGLNKLLNQMNVADAQLVYSSQHPKNYTSEEEIYNSKIIKREATGCITLSDLGVKLFSFFDSYFSSILETENVKVRRFPTLLNVDTISTTDYISTSPQYIMFCSNVVENVHEYEKLHDRYKNNDLNSVLEYPSFSLSPSACFHLYQSIRGETLAENSIYTMLQNVFRNEGRFNWTSMNRLLDYHVREIVMIGNHDFVLEKRESFLKKTIELLEQLQLNFSVKIASDPFVIPVMQKYRKIQYANKVKYEVKLSEDEENDVACASFNIHGKAFSSKFGFSVDGCTCTESGCIGFGIERLIIAFLKQYGVKSEEWPKEIRRYIDNSIII